MKVKLLLLAIFFSFCTSLKAQMVYLPDTAWRNFLLTQGLTSCITGDSLDANCPAILDITTLNCNYKNITDVSGLSYFTNLTSLNCAYNRIQNLDSLPSKLKFLYCSFNLLQSINSSFDSLLVLDCAYNPLHLLPAGIFTNNLTSLNFCGNLISGSFTPPPNLTFLDLQQNQITFLGTLPTSLNYLNCGSNFLNDLPTLPNSLINLVCYSNNLNQLPSLPSNLSILDASYNSLTNIPYIPISMRELFLGNNLFSSLPSLPDSLNRLYIESNLFSQLPQLPPELKLLNLSDNNISIIDSLPTGLQKLLAFNCHLTNLPNIPSTISELIIYSNNIQVINRLPDSLYSLEISGNPISCLPPIHYARTLGLINTHIHCLPERIQYVYSDIDPDTLPLCDINSGCISNWNIRGHVNHDLNLDCNHDSTENFLKNIPVILKSNGVVRQISYSTRYGEYSFKAPFGSYFVLVDSTTEPFKYNCPVGGYSSIILNTTDSIADSLDFHLKCKISDDKLVKSITPYQAFRPGRPTRININAGDASTYYGSTCFNDSGVVYAILSSNVSFAGPANGALTPTTINGDTLIWNIPDFSAVIPTRDFNIQLITNTTATIGDTVCIQVAIFPINDYDSTNNVIQECYPVRASVDPNEKWISPEEPDTSDHEFTFTILFQNTGTAPAYDINLIDTLDSDLNLATFELLGSSHEVVTSIFPGNILRFNFNAIELPDSTSNETESHGFIKYRIKRKANTGAGTEITNTAYIYFDYNAPIVTNTVRVEIATPVGISEFENNEITIYPNPASEFLSITSKNKIDQIQLFDIFGKVVLSKSDLYSNSINLNVANLNRGIYFVNIKENKSATIWNKKIVIY